MSNTTYIGNSAYCYSNSTSMLLASIKEDLKPSLIEVVGGVGIGAYALPDSNISFLSGYSGLPDKAISRSLKTLGFEFTEESSTSPDKPPFDKLRRYLIDSPVLVGPLDMGYLSYDPDHKNHYEIDHFVLIYQIRDNNVLLHDPAGFPNVLLDLNQLELAWKAEKIQYKEGYYHFWTLPKRVNNPSKTDIYKQAINGFRDIYLTGEKYAKLKNRVIDYEAITFMAENIGNENLKPSEIGMLTGFILPLGSRRASDFSDFFKPFDKNLSELKHKQAQLLGLGHSLAVAHSWKELSSVLVDFADLEKQFKQKIIDSV